MKTIPMPAAPMMPDGAPTMAPPARTRRVPQPQPQPDTAGPHMIKTGRGVVAQKPHNPDNQLGAMATVGAKPAKGF